MSEMPPDPGMQQQGGNFFTRKYGGIPGIVWVAGAAVLAYFLFFRNSSSGSALGPSSSGGGGQSTTGDITLQPGTETIDLTGTSAGSTSVNNSAPVTSGTGNDVDQPSQSGVANPQPNIPMPPKKKTTSHPVTHKAGPAQTVTVAQWPGKSVNGLAQWNTTLWGIANHYHTTVGELLKLNPSIKNPDLIHPGQKITVP